jgi:hypothetical protein
VGGVRPRGKNGLFAVKGSPGASQVVLVVSKKDERRGGAIDCKE